MPISELTFAFLDEPGGSGLNRLLQPHEESLPLQSGRDGVEHFDATVPG